MTSVFARFGEPAKSGGRLDDPLSAFGITPWNPTTGVSIALVLPFGIPGAVATIVIASRDAVVSARRQHLPAGHLRGVLWFAVGILYFAVIGRHKLIISPEEEFALSKRQAEYKTH
ncbi:MAG: hypothetical protein JSR99_07020 [Proteobacteria bacterium]|nr:hypothetical protein [Pseudomonadota bacterium]